MSLGTGGWSERWCPRQRRNAAIRISPVRLEAAPLARVQPSLVADPSAVGLVARRAAHRSPARRPTIPNRAVPPPPRKSRPPKPDRRHRPNLPEGRPPPGVARILTAASRPGSRHRLITCLGSAQHGEDAALALRARAKGSRSFTASSAPRLGAPTASARGGGAVRSPFVTPSRSGTCASRTPRTSRSRLPVIWHCPQPPTIYRGSYQEPLTRPRRTRRRCSTRDRSWDFTVFRFAPE